MLAFFSRCKSWIILCSLSLAQSYHRSIAASEFKINAIYIKKQFCSQTVCVLEHGFKESVQLIWALKLQLWITWHSMSADSCNPWQSYFFLCLLLCKVQCRGRNWGNMRVSSLDAIHPASNWTWSKHTNTLLQLLTTNITWAQIQREKQLLFSLTHSLLDHLPCRCYFHPKAGSKRCQRDRKCSPIELNFASECTQSWNLHRKLAFYIL